MKTFMADPAAAGWVVAWCAAVLAAGFAVTRMPLPRLARFAAWMLAVLSVAGAERIAASQPAGFRMLAIIAAALLGMKAVVAVEAQAAGQPRLSLAAWLRFAGWPGMRPAPFTRPLAGPLPGAGKLFRLGLRRLLEGLLLLALARLIWGWGTTNGLPPTGALVPATMLMLTALSLILHFGLFNLVAGGWRWVGIDCRPLFRAPLTSQSLPEFWSKRWNLAFSQMAAIAVYRPLSKRMGRQAAMFAVFLYSGLVHELAISVPVRAGYGLPFAYFVLHGVLALAEQRLGLGRFRQDWLRRAWTAAWLALPLPLLFHRWFLEAIIWPMLSCCS
ncbi:MAG: membrane bound O-acyl transferase family-domain-containing protein [Pirellulales bacterium]